jgi:hypothetical protein
VIFVFDKELVVTLVYSWNVVLCVRGKIRSAKLVVTQADNVATYMLHSNEVRFDHCGNRHVSYSCANGDSHEKALTWKLIGLLEHLDYTGMIDSWRKNAQ